MSFLIYVYSTLMYYIHKLKNCVCNVCVLCDVFCTPVTAPFSSLQFPPEIKHRHLVTFSSTVPPGSEEHTSGQSSTYSHTAQG